MYKSESEILPGKIFYSVCGVNRTSTKSGDYCKGIILSEPYEINFVNIGGKAKFFKCVMIFSDGQEFNNRSSLRDNGIMPEGQAAYNLNRMFHTKEAAENFIKELQQDKFSDQINEEYANRVSVKSDKAYFDGLEDLFFNEDFYRDYDYDY